MGKYGKKQETMALLRVYSTTGDPVHRDVYGLLESYIGLKTKPQDRNGVIRKTNEVINSVYVEEFCKDNPEYKVVICTAMESIYGVGSIIVEVTDKGVKWLEESRDVTNFKYNSIRLLNKNHGKR